VDLQSYFCLKLQEVENYDGLRKELEESGFPVKYMYKFITSEANIAVLRPFFKDADISTKRSSKGKYISFSAIEIALNADQIIDKYKSLAHITGIISL
jgi:putative lipoic acid-binding regulatory protein